LFFRNSTARDDADFGKLKLLCDSKDSVSELKLKIVSIKLVLQTS